MIRIGILGSTRGSNLNAIVDAINHQELAATIEVVISNKIDAPILERATNFGIKSVFANPEGLSRQAFDFYLSNLLKEHRVELVVLIGYMRILTPHFVANWQNRVINVHPSLLPAFSGLMDLAVHQAVLESKAMVTGCSVHYVTEIVDGGPLLVQKKCPVLQEDTPESLKLRVQQLEGKALVEAIHKCAEIEINV
ncbi:phosphoribosylglycinamide formyltransferase [Legionella lansingensis]|uniref:Phosphoribosylglycinamide formyltransferase n=1 Tax=Legionella lansingensis TaxID=45067 RepID=A0A0W0VU22_9GAMM|nr:phosphoribosylglycinamide formyltransferase [Legionella lansingensis]KTD23748.1 phosphoribosylglycinamide formyltransferase [Legionella lansingensis]SNV47517.1 phosphoribosylglycinamide formyltransferase [Legionella lansingensis]